MTAPARALLFLAGVAALAGVVYFGVRAVMAPPEDPEEVADEVDPQDFELPRGQRFERVRSALLDVYETFPGTITATNIVPISVPQGMRVAVTEIVHEVGHEVKKGDVLLRFNRKAIDDAIAQAEKDGRAADAARFRTYLEHWEVKSPIDGFVYEIKTSTGRVPVDEGDTTLLTLADASSFALKVQVPAALQATVAHLGARLTADLPGTNGTVTGKVSAYEEAPEGWAVLVVGLDPREGLEEDMPASLRVPASKREVSLVPKAAVEIRKGVKVVRVLEAEDRMVGERTVQTEGEQGDDWIVTAGVLPDEYVVVPDR